MKKKLMSTLGLILLTGCVFASGCGDKDTETNDSTDSEATVETENLADEETSVTAEAQEAGEENDEADTEAESSDSAEAPTAMECMRAYQKFISGEGEVWFDAFGDDYKLTAPSWYYNELGECFPAGVPFMLTDVVDGLGTGVSEYFELEEEFEIGVGYTYIDCGKDDIPELALNFTNVGGESIDNNFILILKLIDGKLQCVFQQEYGYRSFATLNGYGYCAYGGANGAGSSSVLYYNVDADGQYHFLYGLNSAYSAYFLYIPDNEDYMDVAESEGIADNIEIEQYYFRLYDSEEDYGEYVKNCSYIYYPLSDMGDRLEGDRLSEALADGSYDRFWESTGLPLCSAQDLDEMIGDAESKAGLTDEMKESGEVSWISLN